MIRHDHPACSWCCQRSLGWGNKHPIHPNPALLKKTMPTLATPPSLLHLQLVLPKEPGLEREAVSWFTRVYPRAAQDPAWPTARPIDLIQVGAEGHGRCPAAVPLMAVLGIPGAARSLKPMDQTRPGRQGNAALGMGLGACTRTIPACSSNHG